MIEICGPLLSYLKTIKMCSMSLIAVDDDGAAGGRGHELSGVAVHAVRREHCGVDRGAHLLSGDQHVSVAQHGGRGEGVRGASPRGEQGASGARLLAARPPPHLRQPQRDAVQRAGPVPLSLRGGAAGVGQVLGPREVRVLGRLAGDGAGAGALPRLLLALQQGARRDRLRLQEPGDPGHAGRTLHGRPAPAEWTRVSDFCCCRRNSFLQTLNL